MFLVEILGVCVQKKKILGGGGAGMGGHVWGETGLCCE